LQVICSEASMKPTATRMVMMGFGEMTMARTPGNGSTLPTPLPDLLMPP
jgi:hypothetical protein